MSKIEQDEVLRMAREAGIVSNAYDAGFMDIFTKKLERFAALVAAHEREKQTEQEPVGRWNWNEAKFEWLTKFDYHKHHMTPLYAAPVQQAEQEPVAWICHKQNGEKSLWWNKNQALDRNAGHEFTPLYAAPVRTKDPCNPLQDLTDDEIRFWIGRFPFLLNEESEKWVIGLARVVIAADRAKNNLCERTKWGEKNK